MRYFNWSQYGGADELEPKLVWHLYIQLRNVNEWDLVTGKFIKDWDINTTAVYDEEIEHTDYPFTTGLLPVYSMRLKTLIDNMGIKEIQYLPLKITRLDGTNEVTGYHIANYLRVIDCLNRERSTYQVWTKDNLLFWEKRPFKLGTFRDIRKAVLDLGKINDVPIFRLWGWDMAVVRQDVKRTIEDAGITGCVFREIEVV
jgi:hypothetical protein